MRAPYIPMVLATQFMAVAKATAEGEAPLAVAGTVIPTVYVLRWAEGAVAVGLRRHRSLRPFTTGSAPIRGN